MEPPHTTIRHRLQHPLPRARVPGLPELSLTTRIALLVFGWSMIGLGLVGLVLPILQGVLFLAIGAASLSLVSRTMLNTLRFLMRPWPRVWRAFLRTRRRVLRLISHPSGYTFGRFLRRFSKEQHDVAQSQPPPDPPPDDD